MVFNSGTKDEKVVAAEIVAADESRDLAILKVTGVKELAKPIDLAAKVELIETMNVYMFGFPFGERLSTTKGNPAMTIGKGSVSSIRENEFHDVAVVQIDGDLNPGNSGGPVVDVKGRLVGVAVAKITNTHIGMAIPPGELTRMLNGRVGAIGLKTIKIENGVAEIEVEMQLIDPFNKIKEASLHFAMTDKVKERPKLDKDGKFPPLADAEKIELKVDKQKATGKFTFKSDAKNAIELACQTAYVNGDGKTIYTAAITHRVDFGKPVVVAPTPTDPQPLPVPPGKTPDPKATNVPLLGETHRRRFGGDGPAFGGGSVAAQPVLVGGRQGAVPRHGDRLGAPRRAGGHDRGGPVGDGP